MAYPGEMETFISYLLVALAGLLSVPVGVFFLEVIAAIVLPQRGPKTREVNNLRKRVGILVPAHNESIGLQPTIKDIKGQLRPRDRLLVVVDNCYDDTAAVAMTAGAEVVERHDPEKIGKGYALDWGLVHLSADPPAIVIIIDADCRLGEHAIDRLATTCAMTGRPVQALDLMVAPDESPLDYRVAEFAWRVKNWVRPLGLSALNLPCQLMGTGMAFPWELISRADLASGRIVEDLRLGLDLALAGSPPLFLPTAVVTSHFPTSTEGAATQRQRWEHGHLATIATAAPRLIYLAIVRGNVRLLALTLDMMVPPLAVLGVLLIGAFAVAGIAAFFGASSAALIVSAAGLIAFALAIFLSWLKFGRDVLPPRALLSIGPFFVGKLWLYARLLSRGVVTQWVRTDRK